MAGKVFFGVSMSLAARAVVALLTAFSSNGCRASPSTEITTLQIVRLGLPADARGEPRTWRVFEAKSPAAGLADALVHCTTQEIVKFKPKYRVVATRADGSETTFLALRDWVKIDGVAFKCRQNIQDLIERLWTEEPVAPR